MNVIITGASRGIGYHTALEFAKGIDDLHIFLIARNKSKMEKLKTEIQTINNKAKIEIITFDLSNFKKENLNIIKDKCENIDILINNAGYLINKSFEKLSIEDWQLSMQTNIIGPAMLIKYLLPLLKKSKQSHIINISSMGAVQGSSKFPGLAAYSSSKAALTNLSELLAEELKDTSIKINALALGAVQTEMLEEAFPNYNAPVQANEMAEYIFDFATKQNKFINGKIIPVSVSTP